MRNFLCLFTSALCLTACSVSEDTDTEMIPRPSLAVEYAYHTDRGENTFRRDVDYLDIFVFGPDERLLKTERSGCSGQVPEQTVRLLDGVPEGTYTVVAFANVAQCDFGRMSPGKTTLSELKAALDSERPYPSADRILHSIERFEVRRGRTAPYRMEMNKFFFTVELNIVGAKALSGFSVEFTGATAGIDYAGTPLKENTLFLPELEEQKDGSLSGRFFIPRFGPGDAVTMVLSDGPREIGRLNLPRFLSKATGEDSPIDLTAKEVMIPLTVEVEASRVRVTAADWKKQAEEFPVVGK